MDAPVISMPRFSDSSDNVKVDLGAVHLSNSVQWRSGSQLSDPQARHPAIDHASALHMASSCGSSPELKALEWVTLC